MELAATAELRPRRYLLQSYQKRVLGTVQHARHDEQRLMHKLAVTVLCELGPHLRLNQTVTSVIQQNVSGNPQWNMLVASQVMKHFEKYAWNLIDYPWKKEFLTIKTYSGFYKTHIEPHICHVEGLFGLLGYKLNTTEDQYEITEVPPPERLAKMAFEFYIAGIECEICHAISCKVEDITVADIYHCRSKYPGTISACIERLQEKRSICSSHNSNKAYLTTTDYVETLQPVVDSEYLAKDSKERCCDISSTVNAATKHCAIVNEIFVQPTDAPATARDEHIAWRNVQSCATKDRCQQQNKAPISKVHVEDGLKDDFDENHLQSRPTTELCQTINVRKETWACSSCTFVNPVTDSVCEMCFSFRPNFHLQQQISGTYTAGANNTVQTTSQSCSSSVSASHTVNNYTAPQPNALTQYSCNRLSSHQHTTSSEMPRHYIAVWNCRHCTYENNTCENRCAMCGAIQYVSSETDSVQQ